jgi:hypothetical protein
MLDPESHKDLGKGSIPTSKGVMCKFGARWLVLEVTILEKVEAKT